VGGEPRRGARDPPREDRQRWIKCRRQSGRRGGLDGSRSRRSAVAFQLLIVPVADLRYAARSHDDFAVGYGLTKADMAWFASHYLASPEDADHPYASVVRADLRGMPPAFVITAECDPLRDDGELYAKKLSELGIAASAKRYPGMFHGFMAFPSQLPEAREALDDAGAALRAAFD
jgi:acetyl esterase